MSKETITQISLKANEELIKRTKREQHRSFYMVGREALVNKAGPGEKPEWVQEGIDFIDTIVAVSSKERSVIKLLKDNMRWDKELNSINYIAYLPPDSVEFDTSLPNTMAFNTFQKAFGLLFAKDLVRRVTRHHYMFNPAFFIIAGEQKSYFEGKWNESKQYKE